MTYVEDIEKEDITGRGIKMLDTSFSWEKAKEEIFEKVKTYQLDMFKTSS